MSRLPRKLSLKKETRPIGGHAVKCNPEDFGKKTSPVRERMARAVKETSPEERIRQGR